LVSVIVGEIYDVAVDVRPSSKNFGKWVAAILDDQKHQQLFIPEGFAHGFCILSSHAHVTYKVSTPYRQELEQSFRFDDPDCAIEWPLSSFILSNKDKQAPFLRDLILEAR
jgi:dTDP-4-dehydrorhamnose 3,5-epimerase